MANYDAETAAIYDRITQPRHHRRGGQVMDAEKALLWARRSGVPVPHHQTVAEAYLVGAAASAARIKELEAALEKVSDLLSDAVQADCENGVRSLNEAAARNYLNGFRHTREALMDIQTVCRSMLKEPDQ